MTSVTKSKTRDGLSFAGLYWCPSSARHQLRADDPIRKSLQSTLLSPGNSAPPVPPADRMDVSELGDDGVEAVMFPGRGV